MSIQHVNFFEIIPLNVEIFYAYEVRPTVTNILVRRDNVAWETYLFTKNESSISKHNVKVFRNSPCKTWITEKVQIEEFLRQYPRTHTNLMKLQKFVITYTLAQLLPGKENQLIFYLNRISNMNCKKLLEISLGNVRSSFFIKFASVL